MAQNRFYSSLTKRTTTTVDPGTSGTTLTVVDTTSFSVLDLTFPYTVLINWGVSDQEIVTVTARPTSTTFTIIRGQDGTTGQTHAVGATVDHGVSARDFNEAGAHIGASSAVHGLAGSVVGTSDSQTLSNKSTSDNFGVGGAAIKAGETWHTPTYSGTWAGSTTFNTSLTGVQTLRFRKDAEDNVWLCGAFVAGTGPTNPIFVLPSGSRPATSQLVVAEQSGTSVLIGSLFVSTSGNVSIFGGNANLTSTAAATYFVNAKFPLGNIS